MEELIFNSKKDKVLYDVMVAIEEYLAPYSISFENKYHLDLIIEEILTNIIKYAYKNQNGLIKLLYQVSENPLKIEIVFIDNGESFNPLEFKGANVTDKLEEKKVGLLGIYLVKEHADNISYEYKDNQNRLTVIKEL